VFNFIEAGGTKALFRISIGALTEVLDDLCIYCTATI
jgi:hypothetical protein